MFLLYLNNELQNNCNFAILYKNIEAIA